MTPRYTLEQLACRREAARALAAVLRDLADLVLHTAEGDALARDELAGFYALAHRSLMVDDGAIEYLLDLDWPDDDDMRDWRPQLRLADDSRPPVA